MLPGEMPSAFAAVTDFAAWVRPCCSAVAYVLSELSFALIRKSSW